MYLPKSKYSEAKHTRGDKFLLKGKPYVGWYFKTFLDEYFTGNFPGDNNQKLTLINELRVQVIPKFINEQTEPTSGDREKGTFKRYFLQDRRNQKIVEVKKESYFSFTKRTYIKGITIEWIIKGPAKDVIKPPYPYYGAESKNKKLIESQNNLLPGLKDFIKDYGKFVE